MIKGRIQEFLLHPVFIGFILWLISVFFIPSLFLKYRIKHVKDEYTQNEKYMYFDLDSDNKSEKISVDLNDKGQTKIIIHKENRILDQYNLRYQPLSIDNIYIADYNHDGCFEFYVFTLNQDSIFLNILDPFRSLEILLKNRFVDLRRKAQNSTDAPEIKPVGMIKGRRKEFSDLVFCITTGFSRQPRNVYRYSVKEDSIIKSPESGIPIIDCNMSDINNDSIPELLLNLLASGNMDEKFPFTDRYAWLMVLNQELRFIFPPVQFGKDPSRLIVLPLKLEDKTRLVLLYDYFGVEKISSAFYLYDLKGNKIRDKSISEFENEYSNIISINNLPHQTFYFIKNRKSEVEELDSNFKAIKKITIPEIETGLPLACLDANLDGRKEYFFQGGGNRSLIITQEDFKDAIAFQYPGESVRPFIYQVLNPDAKPMLYLQFDGWGNLIRFEKNPFYYFKYPFYGLLYILLFTLISLIARLQKYRLSLKQETEKKIASLQMKAIKNQIDPHFTLNVLNSIGSLYATEQNREKADYIFGKYTRLIRETVISSDKVIISIEDELEFVKNYIDLERFRFNNVFDYSIDIEKNFDLRKKIPRMLIHTFVENAVKYGLKRDTGKNFLRISLSTMWKKYLIEIEDTGSTKSVDTKTESGTGKGLIIVNELIELFYKLERVQISYSIQDKVSSANVITGKRVSIVIPA